MQIQEIEMKIVETSVQLKINPTISYVFHLVEPQHFPGYILFYHCMQMTYGKPCSPSFSELEDDELCI